MSERRDCPRCGRTVVVRLDGELKNHYPPPDQAVRGPTGVALWCGHEGLSTRARGVIIRDSSVPPFPATYETRP